MINKNNKKKYILVLDLDETLFHTSGNKLFIRPHLKDFITSLDPYFYLIVFTAATKSYADDILKKIGINDYFIKKFYRSSLTTTNNFKNLKTVIRSLIEDKIKLKLKGGNIKHTFDINNNLLMDKNDINLKKIILVDNLEENLCEEQKNNGIIIQDYYGNKDENVSKKDNCLKMIKEFLLHMINIKPNNVQKYLYENLYIIDKYIKYIPSRPTLNCINKKQKKSQKKLQKSRKTRK